MGYALNQQLGWRAVDSIDDLMDGEVFVETQPEIRNDSNN